MQIEILSVWDWINIHCGDPRRLQGSKIFHVGNGLGTIEFVSSDALKPLFNIKFTNGVILNISSRPWRDVRRWRYCLLPDLLGEEIIRVVRDPERMACQAEFNKLKELFTISNPSYSTLGVSQNGPAWRLYIFLKDILERTDAVPSQREFDWLKGNQFFHVLAILYDRRFAKMNDAWDAAHASSCWRKIRRYAEALTSTDAVSKYPRDYPGSGVAAALTSRAATLKDLGRLPEAEATLSKAYKFANGQVEHIKEVWTVIDRVQ